SSPRPRGSSARSPDQSDGRQPGGDGPAPDERDSQLPLFPQRAGVQPARRRRGISLLAAVGGPQRQLRLRPGGRPRQHHPRDPHRRLRRPAGQRAAPEDPRRRRPLPPLAMETHTPHWRRLVLPAGFALACVVLPLLTFRGFGGKLPLEPKGYRFDIPLPRALNLVEGSDVQMSGVVIGRVAALRRQGNRAIATVEIDDQYAPVRSGAKAIVRAKTLLGEGYLELAPGPSTAPTPEALDFVQGAGLIVNYHTAY